MILLLKNVDVDGEEILIRFFNNCIRSDDAGISYFPESWYLIVVVSCRQLFGFDDVAFTMVFTFLIECLCWNLLFAGKDAWLGIWLGIWLLGFIYLPASLYK